MKLEFSQKIFEKYPKSNFMKIRRVGAELYHADRQTDRRINMKLIVAFRNFAKARLKILLSYHYVFALYSRI